MSASMYKAASWHARPFCSLSYSYFGGSRLIAPVQSSMIWRYVSSSDVRAMALDVSGS